MSVLFISLLLLLTGQSFSQVKPTVHPIGGDNFPKLKQQISTVLEAVLLETNRQQKGTGNVDKVASSFTPDAFRFYADFVIKNKAYTARKLYEPQIIQKLSGDGFDVRSITMKVDLGETAASENQNLIFMFDKSGVITSVRAVMPNYDYQDVIARGTNAIDSTTREKILDFIEQFRMAYNSKNIDFLEKVYSEDALIITGSVIKEARSGNEMMQKSFLTEEKVKMIEQTKRDYIAALRDRAFRNNSYLNVNFENLVILQHNKIPFLYGITCLQHWNAASYKDKGYLFLMMDFRKPEEPVIHVRTWQPKAFVDNESLISLYDFDIVSY